MANLNVNTQTELIAKEPRSRYITALRERGYRVKGKFLDGGDVGADYFRISHPEWDHDVESKTFFLRRPYVKTKFRWIELHGLCFRYKWHVYADHGVNIQHVAEAVELYEEIFQCGTCNWNIIINR